MKPNISYHFSVEGNCEKLYLEHLKSLINANNSVKNKVKFHIKVGATPKEFFKEYTYVDNFAHIWDREDDLNESSFLKVIKDIKLYAKSNKTAFAGYSHLAFELWLILHKMNYQASVVNKRDYLRQINDLYQVNYQSHSELTRELNFQTILSRIDLPDVITAINNAEELRVQRHNNCSPSSFKLKKQEYDYYNTNPDILIHVVIKHILVSCGLYY